MMIHLTHHRMAASLVLAIVASSFVPASAQVPRKPNPSQFSSLVTRSPFTIKPDPVRPDVVSPLERDWMLGSIVPDGDGYAVTLINKKDRKDRIRFLKGFSAGEYKLLEVKQDSKSYKLSRVLISKGSQKGWISYDEKLIKVKPSVATKSKTSKTSGSTKSRSGNPPIPSKGGSSKSSRRYVPRTK